ncbi:ion channel [Anaeromyxobacter oryzae]|uniref:Inward rectifier potassium channel protein n=1 Tax=Anaeromyxobacter oryzae TaxID=2918170 RepID=A0ABM7WPJ2_9BACT|nr:ion channel [Anaeromyxobacter oryzae]BDG01390.1 inward rectifier potassium channel protein [Anaeromyxobacter oryzae]
MRVFDHREVYRAEGYEVRVVGGPPFNLRDLYHGLLRVPGWAALGFIVVAYLALNTLFAGLYLATGGIANAAPGSFLDAFFFSIQTMGTIGYGAMYPVTRAANALVVAESVAGLVATALATGLVFARFSQTRARVAFSSRVAFGPLDGTPTVMFRVGNERRGRIVDVAFRLTLSRTTRTPEGVAIYRYLDLPLVRSRAPSLSRAWLVLHRVGPGSPLLGETPASLAAGEVELTLEVNGVDEVSGQHVHAQRTWLAPAIAWGARLADVLSETEDGNLLFDLRRFHEVTPTQPAPGFPYGEA